VIEIDELEATAEWGEPRSKQVSWHDPLRTASMLAGRTGRAFLEGIRDGIIPPPPIALLLGFEVVEVGDGEVRFAVTPDESVYNPLGMVHGGFAATLLDTVLGCAVQTTLPMDTAYTSIELKVSYLRSIHADTRLVAHGWVTKPGRRVAFAEADIRDPDGKVLATASSSLLVLPVP
jgi:uncharacterized protein (TIGR00369 family)